MHIMFIHINIECEVSDLSLLVPLSKSQHSEINSETKTKVPYHICSKKCTILDLQWKSKIIFFCLSRLSRSCMASYANCVVFSKK